jgi:tetratricopeptide (TPR) repeat protein
MRFLLFLASILDLAWVISVHGNVLTYPYISKVVHAQGMSNSVVTVYRDGKKQLVGNLYQLEKKDRVITGDYITARIAIQTNQEITIKESSAITIQGGDAPCPSGLIQLIKGAMFYVGLKVDHEFPFCVESSANGSVKGTEFEVRVTEDRTTIVSVYDGQVDIENDIGRTNVFRGQLAVVATNAPPQVFSVMATNEVQWWLHYPAILDPNELDLAPEEQQLYRGTVDAWKLGNLWGALANLPPNAADSSHSARLLQAAVNLSAARVEQAQNLLIGIGDLAVRDAHRLMIAAIIDPTNSLQVLAQMVERDSSPTWLLGRSYVHQANRKLGKALQDARQATDLSPRHGIGWARRAELEFCQGDIPMTMAALENALRLSPDHAPIHALHGFILAAQNHLEAARLAFEKASSLDPRLPDAWLGLGLLRFRQIDRQAGLELIRQAAFMQPNNALLHGYLGKAFSENFDPLRARIEFERAKTTDPNDPTPWLYSALDLYANNRVNEAIEELEQSIARNDRRAVYRSNLLLDQDRAVRATSLARVFQRAGLDEPAFREAVRAVDDDFTNPSAHLFLADSYNALRDPTRFNLRYETAWLNELLLANLLSPVDAGVFSPGLSQQEYTRLFARDGFRLSSFGEIRGDGQYRQLATQSGIWQGSAYALDLNWQHNDGIRVNNELDRLELFTQIKQQVSQRDTAMLIFKVEDYSSGDNFQYLNPNSARPHYKYQENQLPSTFALWRHEWTPNSQTLLLGGQIQINQIFADKTNSPYYLSLDANNFVSSMTRISTDIDYNNSMATQLGEICHIAKGDEFTLIAGSRFNSGSYRSQSVITANTKSADFAPPFNKTQGSLVMSDQTLEETSDRATVYLYNTWRPLPALSLTAGVNADYLEYPINFRNPPFQDGRTSVSSVLPRGSLIWHLSSRLSLRGMYSESLSGVTLEESYRLEPAQLAGFSQFYRSVIPESLIGATSGQKINTTGLALDARLPDQSYAGIEFRNTRSAVHRSVGAFQIDDAETNGSLVNLPENINYEENAVTITGHRLIGTMVALGGGYSRSYVSFDRRFPTLENVPDYTQPQPQSTVLDTMRFQVVVNFPSRAFSRMTSAWYIHGSNPLSSYPTHQALDLEVGWRFPRQLGEISTGVLNALDSDYRIDPLTATPELPRSRVLFARLRLNF